jgi:hypothetical protein
MNNNTEQIGCMSTSRINTIYDNDCDKNMIKYDNIINYLVTGNLFIAILQ